MPIPGVFVRVAVMLALALLLIGYLARGRLAQIGLYSWRAWSASEKSYFIQVLLLALVIFSLITASRLASVVADSSR